jgi:hypothetical protein
MGRRASGETEGCREGGRAGQKAEDAKASRFFKVGTSELT